VPELPSLDSVMQKLPSLDLIKQEAASILDHFAIGLNAETWWLLPLGMLFVLGLTAAWDAWKGRVPDVPIILGLLLTVAIQGIYTEWSIAAEHLAFGLGVALVLWGLNQLYYTLMNMDAIGMGDAKWTALAVANFGWKPALFAWVIGAWLGLGWMGSKWLWCRVRGLYIEGEENTRAYVHFTPFLFVGLLAGIYWCFLR
jgi:prepilin signal peptidase PulO-like enzyme (type II secretory pathway)